MKNAAQQSLWFTLLLYLQTYSPPLEGVFIIHDNGRGNEYEYFGNRVFVVHVLKQLAQNWYGRQEGYFFLCLGLGIFKNSAKHGGGAICHNHLGRGLIRCNRWITVTICIGEIGRIFRGLDLEKHIINCVAVPSCEVVSYGILLPLEM